MCVNSDSGKGILIPSPLRSFPESLPSGFRHRHIRDPVLCLGVWNVDNTVVQIYLDLPHRQKLLVWSQAHLDKDDHGGLK
jgi:hypothetical protein